MGPCLNDNTAAIKLNMLVQEDNMLESQGRLNTPFSGCRL